MDPQEAPGANGDQRQDVLAADARIREREPLPPWLLRAGGMAAVPQALMWVIFGPFLPLFVAAQHWSGPSPLTRRDISICIAYGLSLVWPYVLALAVGYAWGSLRTRRPGFLPRFLWAMVFGIFGLLVTVGYIKGCGAAIYAFWCNHGLPHEMY
ncbi:MAG TPA: hypothetical protein DGT21_23975 [Armatimonadetes bacterium]|nr:hypothetical protein [Armatimonadota bacterium]